MAFCNLSYGQEGSQNVTIENSKLTVAVLIGQDGELIGDSVLAKNDWSSLYGRESFGATTDAGFRLNIMWSAWSAPGKDNWIKTTAPAGRPNADNVIDLTQHDFDVVGHELGELDDGSQTLVLLLKGRQAPLEVRVTYKLGPDHFYARRRLEVRVPVPEVSDTYAGQHYLRKMWPVYSDLETNGVAIKQGGFGQPIALQLDSEPQAGLFWGMEYPTARNDLINNGSSSKIEIGDYYGAHLGADWTLSDWVVIGLSPQANIRQWFMRYVDDIRAQPLRPYLLYKTWYDLRIPEDVEDPERVLNEQSALNAIEIIQRELTEKRGVALDAFVLDDGWDLHRSDWKISTERFPNEFESLVDKLDRTNTDLGIWFSPIGGYSHKHWRVEWMGEHGYELIGGHQLCIAGGKYHKLFKKRITDFIKDWGVGYYKWDGTQFACNNPSHGHPIGVYSRRAIMDSVASLSQAVWDANPDAFLNISSGTWLSPWWVKYADTIWMQGGDYGFTNVSSISQRDRAITFRDLVLYDNSNNKNIWFPIANLMTVGVIKGKLHQLGEEEALEKFANNALLVFGRGTAKWELYLSPEMLTSDEWDVLAQGAKWAIDRFDILKHSVMIGGDPGLGEAYGHAHFKDDRGIIILRNPTIEEQSMEITLNEILGISGDAKSLVVERVYPQRWISRVLASSGSAIRVDLQGYETAIYEIFPLMGTERPLLAGAVFEIEKSSDGHRITVLDIPNPDGGAQFLNPGSVQKVRFDNQDIEPDQVLLSGSPSPAMVNETKTRQFNGRNSSTIESQIGIGGSLEQAELAVLLQASSELAEGTGENPQVAIEINGSSEVISSEELQGRWGWYSVSLPSGVENLTAKVQVVGTEGSKDWAGTVSLWITGDLKVSTRTLEVLGSKADAIPFPPTVRPKGTIRRQQKLGEFSVDL